MLEGSRSGGHLGPPARFARHYFGHGEGAELTYVDKDYTGEEAEASGIRLEVVRHPEATRGFVLFPRG